jgi:hypothetical protein
VKWPPWGGGGQPLLEGRYPFPKLFSERLRIGPVMRIEGSLHTALGYDVAESVACRLDDSSIHAVLLFWFPV